MDEKDIAEIAYQNGYAAGRAGDRTADEMLRELGYTIDPHPGWYDTVRYYRWCGPRTKWEIVIRHDGYVKFLENGKDTMGKFEEVLACAQLIREMEAKDGK